MEPTKPPFHQRLIAVVDNGSGMSAEELSLAVERHCTSKLPEDDLSRIAALGFRGEALPSIGAVSRMRIVSRPPDADNAWEIAVEAGVKSAPAPAGHPRGTRVEVRDLFFATPARLKFLKTPRTEREMDAFPYEPPRPRELPRQRTLDIRSRCRRAPRTGSREARPEPARSSRHRS